MNSLEPGKFYHIYNRGVNRQKIFLERKNYYYFLQLYKKYINPIASTYAYCLLGNHFHMLIKIRSEEEISSLLDDSLKRLYDRLSDEEKLLFLPKRFSHFFNAYTKAINKTYNRSGNLLERTFKRIKVENESYVTKLIHYIHFNPQKHGIIDDFRDYPYSSYTSLLSDKPTALERKEALNWFYGRKGFVEFHKEEKVVEVDWEGESK